MMYQYWFLHLQGISNAKKQQLIQSFHTAQKIYEATREEFQDYGLLEENRIQSIHQQKISWDMHGEYRKF